MAKYPDIPGWTGEAETGRQAALNFIDRAASLCDQVHQLVTNAREYGVTPDEAATTLGEILGSIRPRFSQLKNKGLIVDSGRRRASRYGNPQIVWVLP